MKTVTLNVEGISQGQWSTFLLELNLMKKAWRPYGVDVKLKAINDLYKNNEYEGLVHSSGFL